MKYLFVLDSKKKVHRILGCIVALKPTERGSISQTWDKWNIKNEKKGDKNKSKTTKKIGVSFNALVNSNVIGCGCMPDHTCVEVFLRSASLRLPGW